MAFCFAIHDESDAEEHPLVEKSAQPSYSLTTDDTAESTGQCGGDRTRDDTSKIQTRILSGIACVFSVLSFCAGVTFSQLLNRSIPHSELNGLRCTVQLFVASVEVAIRRKFDVRVKRNQIAWLVIAAVVLVADGYCCYGYTFYLPLGIGTGLYQSTVLVFLYLASCVITRRMQWYYMVAGLICIFGVLSVVQPPLIFQKTRNVLVNTNDSYHSPCHLDIASNHSASSNESSGDIRHEEDNALGYTLAIASGLTEGIFVLVLNYKLYDMDTMVFMFWASILGVVSSFAIMGVMETPTLPHLEVCVWFLAAHMFFSGTHGFFYAYGAKNIPEKLLALISTINIPVQFLMQYTVLAGMYLGQANAVAILGVVLVFAGNSIVPVSEAVQYWRQTKSSH